MAVLLKRVHTPASPEDGERVLVDRQRPSRPGEEALKFRAWLPVLGPSEELRRWFATRPQRWPEFRRRYLAELRSESASQALIDLHAIAASEPTTTLLTAAEDQERSHAAILRDLLEGKKKPPATSGPSRAASGERNRVRRDL